MARLQCSERILCGSVWKEEASEQREKKRCVVREEMRYGDKEKEAFVLMRISQICSLFLCPSYQVISFSSLPLLPQSYFFPLPSSLFKPFIYTHGLDREQNNEALWDADVVLQNGYGGEEITTVRVCVCMCVCVCVCVCVCARARVRACFWAPKYSNCGWMCDRIVVKFL